MAFYVKTSLAEFPSAKFPRKALPSEPPPGEGFDPGGLRNNYEPERFFEGL